MEIVYDPETGCFKKHEEPYCIMEFPTEEDFKAFLEMKEFWNEHHEVKEES